MNSVHPRLVAALFVSLVAGCTPAPVRYYTLAAAADRTSPATETTLTIELRLLHMPPQLKRAELMVRAGPSEMTLLENERWTSPVADEFKDAVRVELRRRLDRAAGLPLDARKLTVELDVQHFEAEPESYALLEVLWSAALSAGGGQTEGAHARSCVFQAYEKIGSGYAGMVEGYQREIGALAEDIVSVLTSPSGVDKRCRDLMVGSAGGSGTKDH